MYSWGSNDYGQIGDGSEDAIVTNPKLLHFSGRKIKAISAGSLRGLAISGKQLILFNILI